MRSQPPSANFINEDSQNFRPQYVHQSIPINQYPIDNNAPQFYQIQPVYNANLPLRINAPMHAMPVVQSRSTLTHYPSHPQIIRSGPPISFVPGVQIVQRGQFIQGAPQTQSNQSFPQSYSFTTFSQQSVSQPHLNNVAPPSQFQPSPSI